MKAFLRNGLLVGVIAGIYMMVEYAIDLHGKYLIIGALNYKEFI